MCLGIPGHVLAPVDTAKQVVLVEVRGQSQQVSASMLLDDPSGPPQAGDWVVVHLGFAMSRMDEAEAQSVLQGLDDLNDMYAGQLDAHASASQVQQPG